MCLHSVHLTQVADTFYHLSTILNSDSIGIMSQLIFTENMDMFIFCSPMS